MSRKTDFRCSSCGDYLEPEDRRLCAACRHPKTRKAMRKIWNAMRDDDVWTVKVEKIGRCRMCGAVRPVGSHLCPPGLGCGPPIKITLRRRKK